MIRVVARSMAGRAGLLLGLTHLVIPTVHAAPPFSALMLSEYQKQNWQVEDGLPENNIRMIAQQPDGALLLATGSGLVAFDGLRFQSEPIKATGLLDNESVNAFTYGSTGDLWIGTDGRGLLHRTRSGTVNVSERAGLYNERIRLVHLDDHGVLWIATQNGIERFSDERLIQVSTGGMIAGDIVTPFAEDGHGGMFFVTSSGLYHWENGAAHRYSLRTAVVGSPVAVYSDPQHRIWIGTTTAVLQLVPRKSRFKNTPMEYDEIVRARITSAVRCLIGDEAGNLWIGTRRDGIWRYGFGKVSHWTSRDGLPDDAIRSLYVDTEQNLWIGMVNGGLSRWRKGPLAPYGEPEGFPATYVANTFADSRGDLWLGTWGNGLFRRHGNKLTEMSLPGMPIDRAIRALAEDRRGRVWVGTWFQGLYRYDGKAFRHYRLGIESPGNAVSAILADKSGGLWVGTYTGIFHFPSGEPDLVHRSHFLESNLITCLLEDLDGSVLVGTSTGLYRVREGRVLPIAGLPNPYILSLTLDSKGYVWAGTKAGGVTYVHLERAMPMPANGGLTPLLVNSAIEDDDGHLWLSTSRGIVRLVVAEMHAVVDGKESQLSAVILGKADGMRSSESGGPSTPASTRLPDGTLWFTTARGFVHTTDAAEKLGPNSPTASITGWTLSNDPNISDIMTGPRVDIEAGQPDIIFFFNTGLLSNPAHIEYRYRLAGYDSDWTNTRSHTARYKRLTRGNYRFEVQARNSGEGWLSPASTLEVRQHPYFYQTWYFYSSLLLVITALALYLFRRRERLIRGRIGIVLEERNRIASECHDTLMAGFAAISWQLEATAKLFRDSSMEATPAARSCELARSMVSHCQAEARRIIWDLRDSDEVTSLLSQALSRTLGENHIKETIVTSLDVEGEEVTLAPGCVHHLVCIGQEAISNAIRHAQPTHISVRLKYEPDSLSLSIRDDGRGFHASDRSASRHGHFGIPVMEERARKLGGTLRLQTAVGTGTEVTVRVSFNAMQQPANQEQHVIRWIGI